MSDTADLGCRNLRWALALLDGLAEGGLRRLVVSPGSRSTPLVLAGQHHPAIEIQVVLDERSAAFFALGLARASDRPVGLVCTSGSALGHWMPAVMEASQSEIPLILLSADRPPELRGWGANQTLDQSRLFGGYAREFHDPGPAEEGSAALKTIRALGTRAVAVSQASWPGPVHINLPFREPLVPRADCEPLRLAIPACSSPCAEPESDIPIPKSVREMASHLTGRGLICCGPGIWSRQAAEALWRCAERLGVPVLCDPLSGLRFGPGPEHRIARYDSLLRDPATAETLRPDWVLRFGRVPVSKTLLTWLTDLPTYLVDPGAGWSDPNHDVRRRVQADPGAVCRRIADSDPSPADSGWLAAWIRAETDLDASIDAYLAKSPWCEAQLIRDLLAALPSGEGLLCANSMPIRQIDTWSGTRPAPLHLFGNRGTSGIDGQTSTLAGLNAGGVPTTALLGDLSFLHDLSGLPLLRGLDRPCILINNGGGRIFDYLPQHGLPDFERLWRTPIDVDLASLTRSFGIVHRLVEDAEGFRQALSRSMAGDEDEAGIIEVRLDGDLSRRIHRDFWSRISG
ncbi:2-succinyl-5-enolpyruvyl-6-hydroxy-3-cyclohexene-1-carboxylic-acid synthase [Imhoffiella purpurea]|uniref:2-succinyl-5-enolpyruvyl-6-hydroxy-3-cyclohexene-1-carboxylate synthase n=1 Tax=Imhoffiella purpurea TaxID=1249627 RepID=W9V834_9GAMM|nr:2-succinyl-5-enolpyruvyl-6-hydroxy-3-cyclohexene-1-carboxylic-acid synthase [Imhoffiella purpurea]EXJ15589.1 2-succinyl-5-enolpyruvyl-6-hydroxy-3-cyclohexene-1-carboxylic-acid synthase [Imhoffiella purpurea]